MQARSEAGGAVLQPRRCGGWHCWRLPAGTCPRPHWPWQHQPPAAACAGARARHQRCAAGDAFPQYWKRNTLLLDLSSASGSGSITLRPAAGSGWPVRLAFRVTPGAIGVLEVRAAQRTSLRHRRRGRQARGPGAHSRRVYAADARR